MLENGLEVAEDVTSLLTIAVAAFAWWVRHYAAADSYKKLDLSNKT